LAVSEEVEISVRPPCSKPTEAFSTQHLAKYLVAKVQLDAKPPLNLMFLQDIRAKKALEVANFLRS